LRASLRFACGLQLDSKQSSYRARLAPEQARCARALRNLREAAVVKFENVLFATDFSENSGYALTYARTLAELSNTKLLILHVIENPLEHLYGEPHGEYPALKANAIKKVNELIHRFDDVLSGFTNFELCIKEGEATLEILKTAEEKRAGVIVMGTHGGGALRHLLLGGTVEKILRSANVPVMVVRHPSRHLPNHS
jgi:nucleotide-binding universal stress UspA family protein